MINVVVCIITLMFLFRICLTKLTKCLERFSHAEEIFKHEQWEEEKMLDWNYGKERRQMAR